MLGAASRAQLIERLQRLGRYLQANPTAALVDLAYTCNVVEEPGPVRVALIAESVLDLQEKIRLAESRLADPDCRQIKDVRGLYFFAEPLAATGKLAFLFPGEGSQYPHMLADLCLHFPDVRQRFDEIERVFARHSRGYLPSDVIFPHPTFSEEERLRSTARIWEMEGAVEAVLTANRALSDLLGRLGIRPDVIVGHSTGEYSAMIASGMVNLDDEERLNRFCLEMNEIYQGAGKIEPVALIAVAAAAEKLATVVESLADTVHIAMENCPHQTVLICDQDKVTQVTEALNARGLIHERLPFDRPYHTALFGAYADRFVPFFGSWISAVPQITTYSCTTISPFPADLGQIRQVALAHWLEPVRFRQTVERMYGDGVRLFVEIGTGGNLTSFAADTLRGKAHLAIAANTKSRSGLTQLNHLVGALAAQGVPVRLGYLYAHRSAQALDLDNNALPAKKATTTVRLKTGWPGVEISQSVVKQLQRKQPEAATDDLAAETLLLRPVERYGEAEAKENSRPMVASINEVRKMNNGDNGNGHSNGNGNGTAAPALPAAVMPRSLSTSPVVTSAAAQVMLAHMRTMERFLETQQAIMQAYLTGQTSAPASNVADYSEPVYALPVYTPTGYSNGHSHAPALPAAPQTYAPMPAMSPAPVVQPMPAVRPEPVAQPAPQAAPEQPAPQGKTALGTDAIRDLLLNLISERTGYPTEMLSLDLDLEADLGIDSIKRVEIFGLFQQQTDISLADHMEDLSKRKTLRAIVDFLAAHVGK